MNAIAIGPLVFAPDRFAAIVAIAIFLLASEVFARKVDSRLSGWAFGTLIAFILGARGGHVIRHGESFLAEKLRIFYFWQGGFMISAGIALALAFTLFYFRHELRLALWAAIPAILAASAATFVLQVSSGAPTTPLPSGAIFLTLDGAPFEPSVLAGKPLVINLWASWCPPCRREMPMMANVSANIDEAMMIFVNQGENRSAISRYLAAEGLDLDHVMIDTSGEFARHYKVPGLPATLFIGRDGIVQSVHMGEISREALMAGINRIVGAESTTLN